MDGKWPDGWRSAALTAAGLPVDDFTLSVMTSWQVSTPLHPYTNNPIGMPSVPGKYPQLMNTGYALFPTMTEFRNAFSDFLNSPYGRTVREALATQDKLAPAWRAIHALDWPANKTESDWPSALLDMMAEPVRNRLASVKDKSQRRTSGVIGPSLNTTMMRNASSRKTAEMANTMSQAIRFMQTRMGGK